MISLAEQGDHGEVPSRDAEVLLRSQEVRFVPRAAGGRVSDGARQAGSVTAHGDRRSTDNAENDKTLKGVWRRVLSPTPCESWCRAGDATSRTCSSTRPDAACTT